MKGNRFILRLRKQKVAAVLDPNQAEDADQSSDLSNQSLALAQLEKAVFRYVSGTKIIHTLPLVMHAHPSRIESSFPGHVISIVQFSFTFSIDLLLLFLTASSSFTLPFYPPP